MKLPEENLSFEDKLGEFDIWITPSLGEIRDTERFHQEMERVVEVFEVLSAATEGFSDPSACEASAIARTYVKIACASEDPASKFVDLAATLFLVSGKSDNNAKCQLPIFLRDRAKYTHFPAIIRGRISQKPIPRELKADKFMSVVAGLASQPETQAKLLEAFVGFVLSDKSYSSQLWCIGRSYVAMRELRRERDLLTPLVTFQVRGSVSATGGHVPENFLRGLMEEWGLEAGTDFNRSDAAIIGAQSILEEDEAKSQTNSRSKKRAYDFVLPFRVQNWTPRLLLQCQFYAGDSGSVSHKNVDQTTQSRTAAQAILPNLRFIEYVDGAGYFSSLNGDLKNLLAMPTTRTFVQLRSAPIRLRRELQQIGYLTPLDFAHAVLASNGQREEVYQTLRADGYSLEEIDRSATRAYSSGVLFQSGEFIDINPEHRSRVRQYLLLDVTAREGRKLNPLAENLKGFLLVPGYGAFHGLEFDELARKSILIAPGLQSDWCMPDVILSDIRVLCERGFAITG